MSQNRIELVGRVIGAPEVRTTPTGIPVLRVEVDCGEGRELLKLGVVMAGEGARETGVWLAAGAIVKVTGKLRAVAGRVWRSTASGVEVLASAVSEVAPGADS